MANWKKMAEAFGRATRRAEKPSAPDNKAVYKESLRIKDDDVERAFNKGYDDGAEVDADFNALKSSKNDNTRDAMQQADVDYRTDMALANNREKEWDDAFKSAKEHVKRGYGNSYPKDMAEEGADAFEKQLWDVIDELKTNGRSVEDVIRVLKSMGEK